MRRVFCVCLAAMIVVGCSQPAENIQVMADEYISSWARFFPSRALSAGRAESAVLIEDYSAQSTDSWVMLNQVFLERVQNLPPSLPLDDRIDKRMLEAQIERELFRWGEVHAPRQDPLMYSELINHSLTPVLVRGNLTEQQKVNAVMKRLQGLRVLCDTARSNLEDGRPAATAAAIRHIRSTASFIDQGLAAALELAPDSPQPGQMTQACAQTAASLNELAQWMEDELTPRTTLTDAYGEERYARELSLAFGMDMTPARLEQLALAEIQTVRGLMGDVAARHWQETRTQPVPSDFEQLILPVLEDMERNRVDDQQEFLQVFVDLIDRSESFLRERELIDLPEHRSLFTALSPAHFAGAAVGGVYSAGPFDPEAETLFYLPTVADSASEEAKAGFYRSFNNHFNSMIITHEIYPGHYLQLKRAAYHPRRVRALFVGDEFTEGWASFCEQMMLDEGWDEDQALTRLAHLRKRLENGVRAYVSVQLHCHGWSREELQRFAVETGLLPPQFADNLWHRALHSPIQLPSYFLGYRHFAEAFEAERERRGERFSVRDFNDAVVQSGGIPMDMLAEFLESS